MHDLIPIDALPPGALTTAEVEATMAYAEAEKAASARLAYAADWADFAAYCLSGLLCAMGGLFITFVTYTGEASAGNANAYTLNSIAAVVLGGVSLFGGRGSAVGAVFGALIFRTIGDLLFVFDLDPLWQPLFLGFVLLISVCLGSFRLIRIRNRLELFG